MKIIKMILTPFAFIIALVELIVAIPFLTINVITGKIVDLISDNVKWLIKIFTPEQKQNDFKEMQQKKLKCL